MTNRLLPVGQPARNWTLLLGLLLVSLVTLAAIFGPLIAPQDPLQENYIALVNGRYIRPPFPPGVEGYPLGADDFGRDVLSRLLWAVRPTMILVLVVAALRLSAGILLGLLAGWSTGRAGRWLDLLISSSLAIPVLFVALCVVAALARRWGVWAFILGLSITGWAEAARIVQGQTRSIKTQPFIEAVTAMGGSDGQIAFSHLIPHILPLMWIQLAFEVSAALLTTAALGFLGYYIHAVWIPIEDWVSLRMSGTPELSQMLGASVHQQPWTAVFAGIVVFLIVLSFNLLGEGLRLHYRPERRRQAATRHSIWKGTWLEERLYLVVSEWRRTAATGGAFTILAVVVFGGGWILWRAQTNSIAPTQIQIPGGHPWASELHDAQGTLWTAARGPVEPELLWTYHAESGFTGGPVVDQDGNLYLTGQGKKIISIASGGTLRGFVTLPAEPVGWPALAPDGSLVVADADAGLSAFDRSGALLWTYQSDPPDQGLSSPIVGPDGAIYYAVKNFIVAVDAQGKRFWQIRMPTYSYTSPIPRLSPKGEYLFFEDAVVDASTGQRLFRPTSEPMDRYLVGADGNIYMSTNDRFLQWHTTETGAVMAVAITMDTRMLLASQRSPFTVGISPSQQAWLLYSSGFEYMRIVWAAQKGQSLQITDFPYRSGRLIAIDADGVAYLCGMESPQSPLECRAVRLDSGSVIWKTTLDTKAPPAGGALVEGRLYVAVLDGSLFALGR